MIRFVVPLAGSPLGREGGASVGPDPRLDGVEHVRDATGSPGSTTLDLDAGERGLGRGERLDPLRVGASTGRERRDLPGHQAALR